MEDELVELEGGVDVERCIEIAMEQIPDCYGVAIINREDSTVLGIQTVGDHPQQVIDKLGPALAERIAGPASLEVVDAWEATGRSRAETSPEYWVNGHVAHAAARFADQPHLVLGCAMPNTRSPNAVIQQVLRITSRGVIDE